MKTSPKPEFWVTNMSPMNVTLADLALNIRAFSTVNLLDSKHYSYTLEQLLKSKESGSLFKKRDKIAVREQAPPKKKPDVIPFIQSSVIPDRTRSIYQVDDKEYEELQMSQEDQKKQDEIYAQENADLAELDAQRSVINPKKV
jgi:hypothetical protein